MIYANKNTRVGYLQSLVKAHTLPCHTTNGKKRSACIYEKSRISPYAFMTCIDKATCICVSLAALQEYKRKKD